MRFIKYGFNMALGCFFYYPVLFLVHKYFKPTPVVLWFYAKACFFAYDTGYKDYLKRLNGDFDITDEPF